MVLFGAAAVAAALHKAVLRAPVFRRPFRNAGCVPTAIFWSHLEHSPQGCVALVRTKLGTHMRRRRWARLHALDCAWLCLRDEAASARGTGN